VASACSWLRTPQPRVEAIRSRWGAMPTEHEMAKRFIWVTTRESLQASSLLDTAGCLSIRVTRRNTCWHAARGGPLMRPIRAELVLERDSLLLEGAADLGASSSTRSRWSSNACACDDSSPVARALATLDPRPPPRHVRVPHRDAPLGARPVVLGRLPSRWHPPRGAHTDGALAVLVQATRLVVGLRRRVVRSRCPADSRAGGGGPDLG